jgi:hypothetical protein
MIIRAQYYSGMLLQPGDLYCGRGRGRMHLLSGLEPGTWGWLGNPFSEEEFGLERCIRMFAEALEEKLACNARFAQAFFALQPERVLCWCKTHAACHADVIACRLS